MTSPATPADRRLADGAIVGARIRTLDPRRPRATAVAWRDGTIVAVGDDAEVRACCDARTAVLDGAGLHLVPGLTDGHLHPLDYGIDAARGVDLRRCTSTERIRELLAAERERSPDGWVRAFGLDFNAFAGGRPDGALLAEAVGGAPALVLMNDMHTAVATPRALELAGIAGPRELDGGAEVVCRDGRPTGELREIEARSAVVAAMPALDARERWRRRGEIVARMAAHGLVGGHAMTGDADQLDVLAELEARGLLPVRIVSALLVGARSSDESMLRIVHLRGARGRRWRGGVVKFFLDGSVEGGTAWLEEGDRRGESRQASWPDVERYTVAVERFARAGFQCATHAIGDRAVRVALDAYRRAGRAPGVRHRIEHAELVRDDQIDRFADEGVVASLQPLHANWVSPSNPADAYLERVGRDSERLLWRTRDLLDGGATLALGSDWPVATLDPRVGIASAVLRRWPESDPAARTPLNAGQALTVAEALWGYTVGNAVAAGDGAVAGRVRVGMRADLTGFGGDLLSTPPAEIPQLPIALTVVDGEVVHRAE